MPGPNRPIRKPWRPWRPRRRRRGFWWAPASEDNGSTTTAVDSCWAGGFISAIPGPEHPILQIPIIWNVAQNLSDSMIDKLDVAFADGSLPGGSFAAMRHRPMSETWRVERISGHITIEGASSRGGGFGATIVHAGILANEVLDDGALDINPFFNSDTLKSWIWRDQIPLTAPGNDGNVFDSGFLVSGVPSVQHRSINVKTRRRIKPETVMNLYVVLDTEPGNEDTYFIQPMLRAYVTRGG